MDGSMHDAILNLPLDEEDDDDMNNAAPAAPTDFDDVDFDAAFGDGGDAVTARIMSMEDSQGGIGDAVTARMMSMEDSQGEMQLPPQLALSLSPPGVVAPEFFSSSPSAMVPPSLPMSSSSVSVSGGAGGFGLETNMMMDPSLMPQTQDPHAIGVAPVALADPTKVDPHQEKVGLDAMAWAKSLVGRDWEIFWDDNADGDDAGNTAKGTRSSARKSGRTAPNLRSASRMAKMESSQPESVDDVTDWYDAHVESCRNYPLFDVSFVGEDEMVYQMQLSPSIVRPSVQAWVRRTLVVLRMTQKAESTAGCPFTLCEGPDSRRRKRSNLFALGNEESLRLYWTEGLFSDLPPDTATLEDEAPLGQIRNSHLCQGTHQQRLEMTLAQVVAAVAASGEGLDEVATTTSGAPVDCPSSSAVPQPTPVRTPNTRKATRSAATRTATLGPAMTGEGGCLTVAHIQTVQRLVEEQLYLRTKLPSIMSAADMNKSSKRTHTKATMVAYPVGSKDKIDVEKGKEGGEDAQPLVTLEYVDHLVRCLELVRRGCVWFTHDVMTLLSKISARCEDRQAETAAPLSQHQETRVRIQDLSKAISDGRDIIRRLCAVDLNNTCSSVVAEVEGGGATGGVGAAAGTERTGASACSISTRSSSRRVATRLQTRATSSKVTDSHDGTTEDNAGTKQDLKPLKLVVDRPGSGSDQDDDVATRNDIAALEAKCRGCDISYIRLFALVLTYTDGTVGQHVTQWAQKVMRLLSNSSNSATPNSTTSQTTADPATSSSSAKVEEKEASADADTSSSYCTIEDIEKLKETYQTAAILGAFDLAQYEHALQEKLVKLRAFGAESWSTIRRCLDEAALAPTGQPSGPPNDEVLWKLQELRKMADAQSFCRNVEPLDRSSPPLSRQTLDDAIVVRQWVVDVHHAGRSRERQEFVTELKGRFEKLPSTPFGQQAATILGNMLKKFLDLSSCNLDFSTHTQRIDELLAQHVDPRSVEALCEQQLRSLPVVSVAEEKLAVRLDLIRWNERATALLGEENTTRKPAHSEVAQLNEELANAALGRSASRTALTTGLRPNKSIDEQVRAFAENDISVHFAAMAERVRKIFAEGDEWCKKSEAILDALEMYGNAIVVAKRGPRATPLRGHFMVDVRRVNDLLTQYSTLYATQVDLCETLNAVQHDAIRWANAVTSAISNEEATFSECRDALLSAREARPKGVIMDPPRHVFDIWMELVEWHSKVVQMTAVLLAEPHPTPAIAAAARDYERDVYTNRIARAMNSLLVEGREILDLMDKEGSNRAGYTGNTEVVSSLFQDALVKRAAKLVPVEKIRSTPLGATIVSRLLKEAMPANSPVLFCRFLRWNVAVTEFVTRITGAEGSEPRPERPDLREAQVIFQSFPGNAIQSGDPVTLDQLITVNIVTGALKVYAIKQLELLISDATQLEAEINSQLSTSRVLVKNAFVNAENIRKHAVVLKDLYAKARARYTPGNPGLKINADLENRTEKKVKELNWIIRLLPYPTIFGMHQSSVLESCTMNAYSRVSTGAVPFEVLVSLDEKNPLFVSDSGGGGVASTDKLDPEVARLCYRVRELHTAASKWQDEVIALLPLSSRGMKRRGAGTTSSENAGDVGYSANHIDLEQLERMASNAILKEVSFPRQDGVVQIVHQARSMRQQFQVLLAEDHGAQMDDLRPLRDDESLISRDGQFIVYRFTGSSLFASLGESMKSLSLCATELPVPIPEKVAYEWMVRVVAWIEELRQAVKEDSLADEQSKLSLAATDARLLVDKGSKIFADATEDVRKTLAKYKVQISMNKHLGKASVVIGKGGAAQSSGGTTISWAASLLTCLKGDLEKLEQWQASASKVLQLMESKESKDKSKDRMLPPYLLQEVKSLISQARNSLMIIPDSATFQSIRALDKTDTRVSVPESIPGVSGQSGPTVIRFEDGASVVNDRFELLDSLIVRKQNQSPIQVHALDDPAFATEEGLLQTEVFRIKCRTLFLRTFLKGMKMMGIESLHGSDSVVMSYCSLMAWELEQAINSKHPCDSGDGEKMSPEYRAKFRSLRHNLENPKNPTLCGRVLLRKLTMTDLVAMAPEELASRTARKNRAKAEEKATKNVVLSPAGAETGKGVPRKAKAPAEGSPPDSKKQATGAAGGLRKFLGTTKVPTKRARSPPPAQGTADTGRTDPAKKTKVEGAKNTQNVAAAAAATATSTASATATASSASKETVADATMSAAPGEEKPTLTVDPAALADAVAMAMAAAPKPVEPAPTKPPPQQLPPMVLDGRTIKNAAGGDRFTFSISALNIKFSASLFAEEDTARVYTQIDSFLPENLTDKGRLPVDEFNKFVWGKLEGGRWNAVPLRLVSIENDDDVSAYKVFYKEYEAKRRIAMFAVKNQTKLFLVTPRFLGDTACLQDREVSRTSTYAILLTKESLC